MDDDFFMALAIKEAQKGNGRTSPNPCVGALVVRGQQVVGRGYHKKAGTPHAEIHAMRQAGRKCEGATIYITLEPCSHTGRTPPCCESVVKSGIKKAVVGMVDPNPLVSGAGNRYLQEHGVEVIAGMLREKCVAINRPFIKHITTSIPWIIMKAGMSLDGRINYQPGEGGNITGEKSLRKVHRMRDTTDAILVGIDTVIADNPSLTTRIAGRKGHDPIRVVLDSHLRIPDSSRLLHLQSSKAPTWIFCGQDVEKEKIESLKGRGIIFHQVAKGENGHIDLSEVLRILGEKGVLSLLVEGGAKIHGSFLRERLVDHVNLFQAPIFAGDKGTSVVKGIDAHAQQDAVRLVNVTYRRFGDDVMVEGDVEYP